jgi:hypothetical protein
MQNNLLARLPVEQLREALAIREKIDSLERELSRIVTDRSLGPRTAASRKRGRFTAATRAKMAATTTRRAKAKGRRGRAARPKTAKARGQLKERIISALKAAGKPGVTVKDLSVKLGTSYGNISVWFHTTAKKMKEVKKIAPGRFAWVP